MLFCVFSQVPAYPCAPASVSEHLPVQLEVLDEGLLLPSFSLVFPGTWESHHPGTAKVVPPDPSHPREVGAAA